MADPVVTLNSVTKDYIIQLRKDVGEDYVFTDEDIINMLTVFTHVYLDKAEECVQSWVDALDKLLEKENDPYMTSSVNYAKSMIIQARKSIEQELNVFEEITS